MIAQEIFEQQAKELAAIDAMQFALPPQKGYMLAAAVQAAFICLDFPETTKAFCKEFVDGFCDRYRDQLPTVVKAIEDAWEGELVTEDEFEESLGETWRRIARDVEAEMGGEVKIILDIPKGDFCPPHHGALCAVNSEPCSTDSNFYYYPDDCPYREACEVQAGLEGYQSQFEDDDIMNIPLEGDFLEANLDEIESIFAVAPPNHDPETFDY